MIVTARFFAVLRERMGQPSLAVEVEPGACVSTVWDRVIARRPELSDLRLATRVAVNGTYASSETPVHEGDEIAFLPPMSGGAV